MSDDDRVVHVDMVKIFRLLRHPGEPDLTILRIETQDGKQFNFGVDRAGFTHCARVWAFDLGALDSAIESGWPLPGAPVGEPERKAS